MYLVKKKYGLNSEFWRSKEIDSDYNSNKNLLIRKEIPIKMIIIKPPEFSSTLTLLLNKYKTKFERKGDWYLLDGIYY